MKESMIINSIVLIGLMCMMGSSGISWNFVSTVSATSLSDTNTGAQSANFNYTVTLATSMGTIVIGYLL